MKITDIKIDGFGVWHDLALRGLSPELTVFYGPNEAGKSTLMQFMRSVLYGVSPAAARAVPAAGRRRPAGRLAQSRSATMARSRSAATPTAARPTSAK